MLVENAAAVATVVVTCKQSFEPTCLVIASHFMMVMLQFC